MPPKVFLSHASEDKDRFVIDFATKLRSHGVDVWLDKWEMLPGDSLVDKIFEDGIKEATAVIVVLSKFSVQKPWVREELNAAFVARVNKRSKLIPVVIDECEVPAALSTTLWEAISDLSSYEGALDRILAAIFGTTDKPPIGTPPSYTSSMVKVIGGLAPIDSTILTLSCAAAVQKQDSFINPGSVLVKDGRYLFPESEIIESLEILEERCYIKIYKTLGGGLSCYHVTTQGFDVYAAECIGNYEETVAGVVSAIVNQNLRGNREIAEGLGCEVFVVNHIMDVLEQQGLIQQAKMIGGSSTVLVVSAGLRRSLRG